MTDTEMNAVILIAALVLLLIFIGYKRKRRDADRAAYNRQIGQPDLAAPTPSEAHATQRAIRGLLIVVVVLIILGFLFSPILRVIL